MSRRMIRVLLSLVMILAVTVSVWADDSAHYTGKENWVTYTKAGELESNFATGSYEENIEGLLPGDDITFTVTLKNENEASTDWYMSNDVIKSLEDAADAANGGAYEYELTYVDPEGNEDVKFSSDTVGIVLHLDQDELSVPAVRGVHVEDSMSGGARTGKGVEDDGIRGCSNLKHTLNQLAWLRSRKTKNSNVFQFHRCSLSMIYIIIMPQ